MLNHVRTRLKDQSRSVSLIKISKIFRFQPCHAVGIWHHGKGGLLDYFHRRSARGTIYRKSGMMPNPCRCLNERHRVEAMQVTPEVKQKGGLSRPPTMGFKVMCTSSYVQG